jgi:hypothetical protein
MRQGNCLAAVCVRRLQSACTPQRQHSAKAAAVPSHLPLSMAHSHSHPACNIASTPTCIRFARCFSHTCSVSSRMSTKLSSASSTSKSFTPARVLSA